VQGEGRASSHYKKKGCKKSRPRSQRGPVRTKGTLAHAPVAVDFGKIHDRLKDDGEGEYDPFEKIDKAERERYHHKLHLPKTLTKRKCDQVVEAPSITPVGMIRTRIEEKFAKNTDFVLGVPKQRYRQKSQKLVSNKIALHKSQQ